MAERSIPVAGRDIPVTNVDKVLYPDTGTTKGEVIDYYRRVAPALIPHLAGRPVTRKRWPNGVDEQSFFEKNLATSAPDWLDRRRMQHSDRIVVYPVFWTAADAVWLGQQAALEAHVPQWRFPEGNDDGIDRPGRADRIVFDLDPGEGVDLTQCADIACRIRDMVAGIGMTAYPLTSGSKGMHLYIPLADPLTSDGASTVARRVANLLEEQYPNRCTASMAKDRRVGKVFIDWSQNNANKTTIAPYSLRGRSRPTVAAPHTWAEVESGSLRQLRFDEVLDRLDRDGDLLAPLDKDLIDSLAVDSPRLDRLGPYRGKRSTDRTPEPIPAASGPADPNREPIFVIQEHHARRLHYDLRLERDGVLVSWAVPKNLPADPGHNHLAVHTEDHPLEYADFSGDIPRGEYGGGHMDIWDRGTYSTEKWRDDEVIVSLRGDRIAGRYALIRTDGRQWLAHRMKDESPPAARLPNPLHPMLATPGRVEDIVHRPGDWIFEGKWDGYRVLVHLDHGAIDVRSRTGQDYTQRFPGFARLAHDLADHAAVIDAEAVALDDAGVTRFDLLHHGAPEAARLIAFDLLYLDGISLLDKRFSDRRRLLELLTTGLDSVRVPPPLEGPVEAAVEHSRELGWEGIVAKRADAPYRPGVRSPDWIKLKNWRTMRATVCGWRRGKGARAGGIGSLLLGVATESGGYRYVGRVGTGFSDNELSQLRTELEPTRIDDCPFEVAPPAAEHKDSVWVTPELECMVRYAELSEAGILRHPIWDGPMR